MVFWKHLLPVTYFHDSLFVSVLAQILVVFCAMFGLMGNGKSAKIRAYIVSLPYLYMAILYTLKLIATKSEASGTGILLYGIIGLWLAFFGDYYEVK